MFPDLRGKPVGWWRENAVRLRRVSGVALHRAYLRHPAWLVKKAERLGECRECGVCGEVLGRLQVHHRSYASLFDEDMGDLEVLCDRCHRVRHGLAVGEVQRGRTVRLGPELGISLRAVLVEHGS